MTAHATRTARRRDPSTSAAAGREAVLKAALEAFFAHGYHDTSMRKIADGAGTVISHAYYYFPSKVEILRTLMIGVTTDLIVILEAARDAAGADPVERLAALVRNHVRLHTERQAESFVANTELRSLSATERQEVVDLRDHIATLFKDVVDDGLQQGRFTTPHRDEAVLAIITMCTAVAGWYRTDGPKAPEAIADAYVDLALGMVGYAAPSAG
ncbi:MAG: TetR/AcrR family transcriptional regulator [Minwuia sp.]|nr:TetR/AcrR family transcriptional regulator [Minwuia sp.]